MVQCRIAIRGVAQLMRQQAKLLSIVLFINWVAADAHAIALTALRGQSDIVPAAGQSCKQVSSCEEAVALWCGGYRRADADSDGIPCENVCRTVQQVDQIKRQIGC
jgi:hypothetical protein